jgi:ABC-type branched-subunit amino acid transport system substrate-binding protein
MMRSMWVRRLAAVTALALAAAACGNGDTADAPEDTETEEETAAPEEEEEGEEGEGEGEELDPDEVEEVESDGVLNLGYILPESGPLAFLGPPQIQAVEMAVNEINANGGVLGNDVTLASGDEAGDATIAAESAQTHISNGVNAIIGAAASGMSLSFVDAVTSAGVLQCSASNTALTFTNNDYNGLYFRTAPSDILQGPVLAETVVGDGNSSPAILARADDYGQGLMDAVVEALQDQGADIADQITYDPEAASFEAEVNQVAGSGADSVILISFDEGAQILASMVEQGLGPANMPVYGADGIRSNDLAGLVDPNDPAVLDGMRGTAPGADESEAEEGTGFLARFQEETGLDDTTYAAEAYDCTVIVALAAEIAGTDDAQAIAAEMISVTEEGGEECSSFEDCVEFARNGEDFTYVTASGIVLTTTDGGNGEPDSGTYEVWEIDENGEVQSVEFVTQSF